VFLRVSVAPLVDLRDDLVPSRAGRFKRAPLIAPFLPQRPDGGVTGFTHDIGPCRYDAATGTLLVSSVSPVSSAG
jgi:hypothetical protein